MQLCHYWMEMDSAAAALTEIGRMDGIGFAIKIKLILLQLLARFNLRRVVVA
jgi:hypothetical protein